MSISKDYTVDMNLIHWESVSDFCRDGEITVVYDLNSGWGVGVGG